MALRLSLRIETSAQSVSNSSQNCRGSSEARATRYHGRGATTDSMIIIIMKMMTHTLPRHCCITHRELSPQFRNDRWLHLLLVIDSVQSLLHVLHLLSHLLDLLDDPEKRGHPSKGTCCAMLRLFWRGLCNLGHAAEAEAGRVAEKTKRDHLAGTLFAWGYTPPTGKAAAVDDRVDKREVADDTAKAEPPRPLDFTIGRDM